MKGKLISLISVIFLLLVSMAMTGCASELHMAVGKGDTKTVKELLDKGANVEESLVPGFPVVLTPLMHAAQEGHLEIVKILVDKGADVNAVYDPGSVSRPTLAFAAIRGHKEIVKYLVDKGADIDEAILALSKAPTKNCSNSNAISHILSASCEFAKKDNWIAMKFLREFKREMADSTQQKGVQTAALDKTPPTIKSDIDELPFVKAKPSKNSYAVVIGIEQYREKLPKADFAKHDAEVVAEYLTKVMGYPEENVITLLNERALKSDLEKYIERWLPNNVEKDGTLFIYYSGHGAPNPKTGDAYLVPYDGDPTFIEQTGYSLKRLYESLSRLKAKEIVVALDSCFSGAGGRSVIAKGARPMVITIEGTMPISQNVAVISAAGGEEISSTYDEKGHGLFTYFMLKGLKGEADTDANGKIEIQELYNYIKPQVERVARRVYNNEQTPQLVAPVEKQRMTLIEGTR